MEYTNTDVDFDEVAPDASAMIESMRAYGYTLATAVADLIDNSITARSKNIWLRFEWSSHDSWIAIADDGVGMTEPELVDAMRLGSRSPVENRDPKDLGRFGLGLKTASFSQARRLTVLSKRSEEKPSLRRWDLDHLAKPDVKSWQLLRTAHDESKSRLEIIDDLDLGKGTLVLLERLDRVVPLEPDESVDATEDHFVKEVEKVRQHLGMVFHRFLSDPAGQRLSIFINGEAVEPWDPFCRDMRATQVFPEDFNADLGHEVRFKGFVLPHRDKFDESDDTRSAALHKAASGPVGWNAQQGFYLYRNRRLIIPGDWLGLGPGRNGWSKEEHYKLARILVDIPNSMDHEWHIDVKKSTAAAPPPLRSWLTGLAKTIREEAKSVYAHRGGRKRRSTGGHPVHPHPWVTKSPGEGVFSYRIDRKHPVLKSLLEADSENRAEILETLLRLIEETVPVQRIWIDTADNQDGSASPFEGEKDQKIRQHISICRKALVDQGCSETQAWTEISSFPGFQTQNCQAIIGLLQEKGTT